MEGSFRVRVNEWWRHLKYDKSIASRSSRSKWQFLPTLKINRKNIIIFTVKQGDSRSWYREKIRIWLDQTVDLNDDDDWQMPKEKQSTENVKELISHKQDDFHR